MTTTQYILFSYTDTSSDNFTSMVIFTLSFFAILALLWGIWELGCWGVKAIRKLIKQ